MRRLTLVVLLVLAALVSLWVLDGEGLLSLLLNATGFWPALLVSAMIYALLMSLPFVPGVELGWLIIALFGLPGILTAWAATVIGLSFGYGCGKLLREHRLLRRLEEKRRWLLQARNENLSAGPRLLRKCLREFERHPYLVILLALNIPGNWIIGGGGGIAWISGSLPRLRFLGFFLTVTVATGIVPALLLLEIALDSPL